MKDKKRQRKYFSYKKMRETFENSDDKIEKRVLRKILSDYEHNHKNELFDFEKMLKEEHQNVCPNCGSIHVVKDGKNRNGTARLKCSDCKKRFNPTSHSFFYSTKVNMDAWLTFIEGIVSETSIKSACTSAKISIVTGTSWMKKIFKVLDNYQDSIVLEGDIYIDETYVHEDSSKIYYKEEIDEETKIRKQPRGISRNKIGILLATNGKRSFAKIIGHGRPARLKNYEICLTHIKRGSLIIGDEDKSLTYAAKKLDLNRTTFKANTQEAYDNLKPIDELCKYFKFFIDKHRGFKKEALQDYINLFIFLHNEKINDAEPYKIAEKLLKMLFAYQKTDEK
jgi:transposase-like protein